jgi:NTP pyrophosphatase (non-canonical NTP hydrolase)
MIGGIMWPGLSKLIEECGEVLQVVGKLMGSAGSTDHWSGDLNQMLIEELGDLRAAITFFMEANAIDSASVSVRHREKLAKFWEWHRNTLAGIET